MKYTFEEMMEDENKIQSDAVSKCSECLDLVIDNINLNLDLFKTVKMEDFYYFMHFYSQYNTALFLAMLSIIRVLDYQHKYNMRYALESAAIMNYAIYNRQKEDSDKYYKIRDNIIITNKSLKINAYKLIEEKYPETSKKMIDFKALYNESTHSNFFNAQHNLSSDDRGYGMSLYDKYSGTRREVAHINAYLWSLSDVNIGIMSITVESIKDCGFGKYIEKEFEGNYMNLQQRLMVIKPKVGKELNAVKRSNIEYKY